MDINIKTKYSIGDKFKNGHYEIKTIMLNIRENEIEILYNLLTKYNECITVDDDYIDNI